MVSQNDNTTLITVSAVFLFDFYRHVLFLYVIIQAVSSTALFPLH